MLVAAKCTQCGADIEVDDSQQFGVCRFCNTSFITEKVVHHHIQNITNNDNSQKIYNVENVNIYSDEYDRITNAQVLALPIIYDKQTLVKDFFISAQANDDIPKDFFEKLENVDIKVIYEEYWEIERDIEFAWNATIGVDSSEHYIEQVKQDDGSYVHENRTRTVTNWSAQCGIKTFTVPTQICKANSEPNTDDEKSFKQYQSYLHRAVALKQEDCKNTDINSQKDVERKVLSFLKKSNEKEAIDQWKRSPIGDKHRDLTGNVRNKNIALKRYLIPFYSLSFMYDGTKFQNTFNAMQYDGSKINLPTSSTTSINARFAKEAKRERTAFFNCLAGTIIAAILAILLLQGSRQCVSPMNIILLSISTVVILGMIALLVFTIKFYKLYKNKLDEIRRQAKSEISKSYESKLEEILLKIQL